MVQHRRALRALAIAATFGIALGLSNVAGAPAHATTCSTTPTTWALLKSAFASASSGAVICLGAPITGSSDHITVPSASNVTLDLSGQSLTVVGDVGFPGVYVPQGTSLTIDATGGGSLSSTGTTGGSSGGAAGIGGIHHSTSGAITINGGTITAIGSSGAAGIGGGFYGGGGAVTINGGTIDATGANSGDGIGGGWSSSGVSSFTMTGGSVTAVSVGNGAQGLAVAGAFQMSGGSLTATGVGTWWGGGCPGIWLRGSTNSFSGGTIVANGAAAQANGITVGEFSPAAFNVTGGSITATGSADFTGAAIGAINNNGTLYLPSTGGTPVLAGSGFGSGAVFAAAITISATLAPTAQNYSMAGTRDATASLTARTVIVFSSPQPTSSSGSSSANGSSNPAVTSSASSSTTLAATGIDATGLAALGALALLGALLLLGRRRATLS